MTPAETAAALVAIRIEIRQLEERAAAIKAACNHEETTRRFDYMTGRYVGQCAGCGGYNRPIVKVKR